MEGGKNQCQPIWDEFSNNRELLNSECIRIVKERKRTNIDSSNNSNQVVSEPSDKLMKGVLNKISDKSLISKLNPILSKNKVLEAVGVCIKFYEGMYHEMTFKDWFKLVKELYDNNINETKIDTIVILHSSNNVINTQPSKYRIDLNIAKKAYTDEELEVLSMMAKSQQYNKK